jgi:hypothetical protein
MLDWCRMTSTPAAAPMAISTMTAVQVALLVCRHRCAMPMFACSGLSTTNT